MMTPKQKVDQINTMRERLRRDRTITQWEYDRMVEWEKKWTFTDEQVAIIDSIHTRARESAN